MVPVQGRTKYARLVAAATLGALIISTAVTPQAGATPAAEQSPSTVPNNMMEANGMLPAQDAPKEALESFQESRSATGLDIRDLDFLGIINLPPKAGQELIFRPRKYLHGDFSRANLVLALNKRTATPHIVAKNAEIVGQPLLGLPAANKVSLRAGVWAADLGITWEDGRGRTLIAFGDNYGPGHLHPLSRFRGSALGHVNTRNPYNVRMTSFFTGYENMAEEIVESKHRWNRELSKIPTTGIAINGTQYIDFMSVREWGEPGYWTTNWSRIYKSTDYGRTWAPTRIFRPNRGGYAKFQMGSFVRVGDYVYEMGTPNGRMGNAYVSRVKAGKFEKPQAWQYWNGRKWVRNNPAEAVPVIPGRVSELTVQWNPALKRFMLLTLGAGDAIYLMYSKNLTHWTNKYKLIPEQRSKVYSPYFLPRQSGQTVFFTLSTWFPYTVSTVKAKIPSAEYMDNLPYRYYPEDKFFDITDWIM